MKRMIYLDYHATTPVDARVLEAMLPFFTEKFGNAASKQHRFGWDANDAVERARKQIAALIGAEQQGHRLHQRRHRGEQPRDQGSPGPQKAQKARGKTRSHRDDRD